MTDIQGYRKLSDQELDLINEIKNKEYDLAHFWKEVGNDDVIIEPRWMAVAKTHFEEGFMALVRAVTKPEDPYRS